MDNKYSRSHPNKYRTKQTRIKFSKINPFEYSKFTERDFLGGDVSAWNWSNIYPSECHEYNKKYLHWILFDPRFSDHPDPKRRETWEKIKHEYENKTVEKHKLKFSILVRTDLSLESFSNPAKAGGFILDIIDCLIALEKQIDHVNKFLINPPNFDFDDEKKYLFDIEEQIWKLTSELSSLYVITGFVSNEDNNEKIGKLFSERLGTDVMPDDSHFFG